MKRISSWVEQTHGNTYSLMYMLYDDSNGMNCANFNLLATWC